MKDQTQPENRSALDIVGAGQSVRALRQQMTFLKALTPKERSSMPRVTPSALTLMESALQAAQENPGLIPPSIELARYENEVQSCRGLFNLLTQLQELCSDVQDTMAAIGKEANDATQQVRIIIRTVAKTKPTPGLKLLSQRLNPRPARAAAREAVQTSAPTAAETEPAPAGSTEPKAA